MDSRKVKVLLTFAFVLLLSPAIQLRAEGGESSKCEIAGSLFSIYLRAYSFVLDKVESSNLSLEHNISVSGISGVYHSLNLSDGMTMSIENLLNLSYSLAMQANLSLGNGNCSQASFMLNKALNLLRVVLREVHKTEISSNLTSTPIGALRMLQVAFERHKRLLFKLNLSIQKIVSSGDVELNLSLFNELYKNATLLLENGSMMAFYNASEAARIIAEVNKIRAEMIKEISKGCQIVKAEKMLNKTLSKLNLSAVPEKINSTISNLTEEFAKAKAGGDVKKIKEILREVKKTASQVRGQGKGHGRDREHVGQGRRDKDKKDVGKGKGRGEGRAKGGRKGKGNQ
ncbi:MAG TPA: hypothetical protein EYP68_08390 [Candidatus Korarchaeota archaeon]|nr:hypothetical protein [Candidatus Korarchaeota archaeon]